ncbi:MAG: hypothetical protein K6U79_02160 [Firmicutes bacterium]|nr:hypothetical protein [Bacillota bacterium]
MARRPEGPWRPFGAEEAEAGTGAVAILDAAVVALERGSERLAALMLLSEGGRLELRLPPAWETKVALHLTEAGLGAAPLRLEAAGLGDEVLFLLRPRPSPGPGKTADPRQLLCLGSLSIDGELRLPLQPLEGFDPERSGLAVCAGRVYLVLARPEEPVEIRTRAAGPWPGSAWRPGAPLPGSERLPRGHWAVSRRHPDGGGGETLAVWRSGGGALVWRLAEAEGVWELRPVDELLAGAWLRVAPPLRGHADWEGSWLPRAACGTIQELPIVLPDIPG